MILTTSTAAAGPPTLQQRRPRCAPVAPSPPLAPSHRHRPNRPNRLIASSSRGSGNRYRELVERDVLPDGSPNTPARRLSAAVRDAPSLRALGRLRARTGGRGSSAWHDGKHAPAALMRAASLHYYRLVGERGGAAGRLRRLLMAAAAAQEGRRETSNGSDRNLASSTTTASDLAALLTDLAPAIDRDPQVAKRVEGDKIAQLLVVAWRVGAAIADVPPLWPLSVSSNTTTQPLIPAHAVAPLTRELTRSGGRKVPGHAPDLLSELAAALAGLGWRDRRLWLALGDAARRALLMMMTDVEEDDDSPRRGNVTRPAAFQAADMAPMAAGLSAASSPALAALPATDARAVLAGLARAALRAGSVALLPPGEIAVLARAYAMAWGPRAGVAELERLAAGQGEDGDADDDDQRAAVDVAMFVASLAEEAAAALRSAEAPGGHDLDAALFAPHWDEEEEEEEEEEDEDGGGTDTNHRQLSSAVGAAFFGGAASAPPLSVWCATSGWPTAVPPPRDYVDVLEATHGAFGCCGGGATGGGGESAAATRLEQAHATLFAAAAEHVLAARPFLEPREVAVLLRVCASEATGGGDDERAGLVGGGRNLFLARRLAARLARAMATAAPLETWRPREVASAADALAELCAARAPAVGVAGDGPDQQAPPPLVPELPLLFWTQDEEEEEEDDGEVDEPESPSARRARAASAGRAASAREAEAFSAALRAALAAAAAAAASASASASGPRSWPLADLVAVLCAGVRGLAADDGGEQVDDPLLLLIGWAAATAAAVVVADEDDDQPKSRAPPLPPAAQADLLWALSRVRGLRAERERLVARLAAAVVGGG